MNSSSGMHVCVGNGSEGFTTPTVRNILTLTTVFERLWDSVQAASRISSPFYGRCAAASRHRAGRPSFEQESGLRLNENNNYPWAQSSPYNAICAARRTQQEEELTARSAVPPGRAASNLHWSRTMCDHNPGLRASCKGMSTLAWYHIIDSATSREHLKHLHCTFGNKCTTVNIRRL